MGLRFGGCVLADSWADCGLQKLKGQPGVSGSLNEHRASLRPIRTRRDDLKINKLMSAEPWLQQGY